MKIPAKPYDILTGVVLLTFLMFAGTCAFLMATGKPVPEGLWATVGAAFTGLLGMVTHKQDGN